MADPTREDFDRFQAALTERPPGEPLWAAIDRATQAALMSLGPIAAGVAGAITRLATEFEQANAGGGEHHEASGVTLDATGLRRIAEGYLKARYELTAGGSHTTEINLPFIGADVTGPKHFQRKVSARELAALELR